MKYWLMKTEPETYSIDNLKKDKITHWEGIRNYQARNYMRDDMKVGDGVLIYHSNTQPLGVVGLAKIAKEAYHDYYAWDKQSRYYDMKASPENPRWVMVDVAFVEKFTQSVNLEDMKKTASLEGMLLLKKGQRLSIQPVEKKHYDQVIKMAKAKSR